MKIFNKPPWLLLFALTYIVTFWSLITPIFEFPDETAHFGTVEFLTRSGKMPWAEELDMTKEMAETQKLLGVFRNNLGQNNYTYHPEYRVTYSETTTGPNELEINSLNQPDFRTTLVATEAARYPRLYYQYASIWDRLSFQSDILTRVIVVRLGGAFLTLLTAYIVWQIGYFIFGRTDFANILVVITMLQPMLSFVSAGINSDNLHNLLFFTIFYFSLKLISHPPQISILLPLVLCAGLDVFTKPQGFIAIPLVVIALIISCFKHKSWHYLWTMCIIGPILLFLVRSQLALYFNLLVAENVRNASFIEFVRFSFNKLITQNIVWYWGVFKWLGVVLPPLYWRLANRLVILSGLGIFIYFIKVWRKKVVSAPVFTTIFTIFFTLFYVFTIYWFDWQYVKTVGYSLGVQARYYFPTLVGQMTLLLLGILSFSQSPRLRAWLALTLSGIFLWLQLGGIWRLISSYYDLSSLHSFILQASQYKPFFAKGEWWYLWIALYLVAILYLLMQIFKPTKDKE